MGGRSQYSRGVCPRRRAAAVLALLALSAPCARAVIPDIIFTLRVRTDSGQGMYTVPFEKGEWDPDSQTLIWLLPEPVEVYDDAGRERLATLLNAEIFLRIQGTYEIHLNVGVLSARHEATFLVASPLISFPTIPDELAEARATACFTVTDLYGDGACLTGLGLPGTGAFRAYYNGYLFEGTWFTHLISRIFVGQGGTASAWQGDPLYGYRAIDDDVSDISTELAFTLTPEDLAFATTTMDMPEPDEVCVGDINEDGVIDADDLSELLAAYGTEIGDPDYNEAADLDANGCVDLVDASELLAVYGQTCP